MSGQNRTRHKKSPQSLGSILRELREKASLPGWKVASAAKMDSTLLSKIENGKRAATQAQLAALAKFFKVELEPLETRRLAEEMLRSYGNHPAFAAASA